MKYRESIVCVLVLLAGAAFALDDARLYVRAGGGAGSMTGTSVKYDTAAFYSVAVGNYYETLPLRIEGELSFQDNAIASTEYNAPAEGNLTTTSVMLNAMPEWRNESRFSPYALAGAGLMKAELEHPWVTGSSIVPAFQLGAGLGTRLTDHVSVDAEYRYYATITDPGFEEIETDIKGHRLLLTLRVTF